jgi:hypothetical protein
MGFWHTGYIDFHEPVGLEGSYPPETTVYQCQFCELTFDTADDLRTHRFDSHPYKRPLLFIRGLEVGTAQIRITRVLEPTEISVSRFDHARINGKSVTPKEFNKKLAKITNDRVAVELTNKGVSSRFDLSFEIASETDLEGVDSCFLAVARLRRLDLRSIEDFISTARRFPTALGYCDGICEYLYGVLAKERATDTSLSYPTYREKFGRAADLLKDFYRPLAQVIRALVAFHFNHFSDSLSLASNSRVGLAATRFDQWLSGDLRGNNAGLTKHLDESLEKLLTDLLTEKIVVWTIAPAELILRQLPEIESTLKQDIPEFDRAKLRMLLAEFYLAQGQEQKAKHHSRELINNPTLGRWAQLVSDRMKTEVSRNA